MKMIKNRKAVSPVIATVILVAVAITISVAVAYWMGGISSQYTKFEKVEVSSAVCTLTAGVWQVDITLKNTGTAQATISDVFINDRKIVLGAAAAPAADAACDVPTDGLPIASGAPATVTLWIVKGTGTVFDDLSSGTTINMKFHSAGGMDYLKLIELV